jgi:hypothetical protein
LFWRQEQRNRQSEGIDQSTQWNRLDHSCQRTPPPRSASSCRRRRFVQLCRLEVGGAAERLHRGRGIGGTA